MKIHTMPQRSDEWFAFKLGKFGASDGQAVASNGKGLETLAFEKAAERLTGKRKESYTNGDMERGNELEEMARNSLELEYGKVITQVGLVELNGYTIASPDGLVEEDGLVEIKCPSDTTFLRFMYDKKIDTSYVWQMQMQMYVSGRKWVDYALFNPNYDKSLIINRVERDEEAIAKLILGLQKGEELIKDILSKV